MAQNVGQSRGSQKHKQFVQDSANSYIVDAFKDMAETAPLSPVDGEGYIVSNVANIDPSWGTITGLADNDIIRWRQSKLAWQIVMKAVVANQGFKAFVKDEDTLYVVDSGAEWIVASGSGGGVKNFAQKQASAYKPGDWFKGNSGIFGASGTLDGVLEVETVAPLDGKKSFKYTTGASSGDDWFYLLVDISEYARGGVIAFTFDYQWNGDEDIRVHIWDPTFTNEYSTELNLLKNTENDNKKSRNSRTIFALPDTESQVVVGFQINSGEAAGKILIWDNIKVTDDIGVIGSGGSRLVERAKFTGGHAGFASVGTQIPYFQTTEYIKDGALTTITNNSISGMSVTALKDCVVQFDLTLHDAVDGGHLGVSLNSNNLNSTIASIPANERMTIVASYVSPQIDNGNGTVRFQMKAGDIARVHGNSAFTMDPRSSITITVEGDEEALRFLQVPNGEKLKDTFGARINCVTNPGGQPIITSQSKEQWIQSVSRISTGFYEVVFTPGFFSVPPSISGSAANGGRMLVVVDSTLTVSGVRIETSFATGAAEDGINFTLNATRQEDTVDIVGVPVSIQGQTHEQDSMVSVRIGNGFGSTGTSVRRFSTISESIGNAITYVDDPVNGARFEINQTGFYSITFTDFIEDARNTFFSITKNSTALNSATGGGSNFEQALAIKEKYTSSTIENADTISWSGILKAGDVIRAQTGALAPAANSNFVKFTIAKVGTQPLLDGGLVETPGSNFRIHGIVGNGFVAGTRVIRFNAANIAESGAIASGDIAFVDSTSDSYIEILEDGFYSIGSSTNMNAGPLGGELTAITVNASDLTVTYLSLPYGQILAGSNYHGETSTGNPDYITSWSGRLNKGDKIRIMCTNASKSLSSDINRNILHVNKHGQTVKYSSRVYKEDPIAWQRKIGDNNNTAAGDHLVLDFNNLEAGKTYRISGLVSTVGTVNSQNVVCLFRMSGSADVQIGILSTTSPGYYNTRFGFSHIFTATADKIEFIKNNSASISNSVVSLNVTLEELPWHAQTSKWT